MHDNDETRYEIYRGTNKGMEVKFCMYGRPYCMDEADRLELEVRDYRNNNEIVIAKSVTGDNYFTFYPEDTENLDIGFYVYIFCIFLLVLVIIFIIFSVSAYLFFFCIYFSTFLIN